MPDLTDAEIVAACARAMGIQLCSSVLDALPLWAHRKWPDPDDSGGIYIYDPRTNKAQVFDLVERLRLRVNSLKEVLWEVSTDPREDLAQSAVSANLQRAICTCAAAAQLAKEKANG